MRLLTYLCIYDYAVDCSGLRIILAMLNTLLFACAAFKVFSPHFEIMFVMSVCLTLLYFQ